MRHVVVVQSELSGTYNEFLQLRRAEVASMRSAYSKRNFTSLSRLAHIMCGASERLNLHVLEGVARHLEYAASEPELFDVALAIEAVDDTLGSIVLETAEG